MRLVDERADELTVIDACEAVDFARANYYRVKSATEKPMTRRRSHRRLSEAECDRVLDVLTSDGYCDKSVRQAWAELIDAGTYLLQRADDVPLTCWRWSAASILNPILRTKCWS